VTIFAIAQLYEVRALERALGEQNPVVGDDTDRVTVDMRKAADQGLAVARFEFVQLGAIDDACDHLADIERLARVLRNHAVQFVSGVLGFAWCLQRERYVFLAVETGDDVARDRQRMRVVLGVVIGHARDGRMDVRTAERFSIHYFAGGGFH